MLLWIALALLFSVLLWPTLRARFGVAVRGEPRPVTPRGELAGFEQTAVDIFERSSPSVVYITTRARVANPWSRRVAEVEAGTGSGFVWDGEGHVVTNFHVIENASSARVVFDDQRAFDAEVVGVSPDHDLAVLRVGVMPGTTSPVAIGESADLRVGQAVFAIGNPFGLTHTLTTGVVSARSRTIAGPGGRAIEDVIQIDAAINPGNSGGPLLDSAGRLIGVNTAIYSPSGASAGVGFAVPVDTVNRVVPMLIAQGRYRAPRLGIRVNREWSDALTRRLGVKGVMILEVEPGGGAAAAGLRGVRERRDGSIEAGDVIQRVGDRDVAAFDDLLAALERHEPGDTVPVRVLRDGETLDVGVRLE